MSKHTKGKWESIGAAICVGDLDIARVYQPNGMDTSEFYADARLIAAAPELLEALMGFMNEFGDKSINNKNVWNARSAIAKATGK